MTLAFICHGSELSHMTISTYKKNQKMSSLSWAATCPVKNWKIKHRGRRLCCTVSVVSSRTYHSTLTHHAPATQTSFVLFKEARLSPVSGLGSCSFTCLAHTSSDLPTAGFPSLFRTQFKCHLLRENRTLRGALQFCEEYGKVCCSTYRTTEQTKKKINSKKNNEIKTYHNILQLAQQHLHKHKNKHCIILI